MLLQLMLPQLMLPFGLQSFKGIRFIKRFDRFGFQGMLKFSEMILLVAVNLSPKYRLSQIAN
jgi:hypothetical protein